MFNKNKLISLMNEKGLTLSDVSKICGIAYSTLRDLYTGKNKNPLANTLSKMARGLNINADYFVDDEIEIELPKSSNLETTNMIIEQLIQNGLIKDDNIDENTAQLLLGALKAEINIKLNKKKLEDKK